MVSSSRSKTPCVVDVDHLSQFLSRSERTSPDMECAQRPRELRARHPFPSLGFLKGRIGSESSSMGRCCSSSVKAAAELEPCPGATSFAELELCCDVSLKSARVRSATMGEITQSDWHRGRTGRTGTADRSKSFTHSPDCRCNKRLPSSSITRVHRALRSSSAETRGFVTATTMPFSIKGRDT